MSKKKAAEKKEKSRRQAQERERQEAQERERQEAKERLERLHREEEFIRGVVSRKVNGDLRWIEIEWDSLSQDGVRVFSVDRIGILTITFINTDEDHPEVTSIRLETADVIQRAVDRQRLAIKEYEPS